MPGGVTACTMSHVRPEDSEQWEGEGRMVSHKTKKAQTAVRPTHVLRCWMLSQSLPEVQVTKNIHPLLSSTERERDRGAREKRLPASTRQPGWGSTAGCQPLCSVRRCLFHSLAPRGRERHNLSHGWVFLLTQFFFQTFPSLVKKRQQEGENGGGGDGSQTAGPCRVYTRLMVFYYEWSHRLTLITAGSCTLSTGQWYSIWFNLGPHVCVCVCGL